jgi:hypothetical protein
MEFLRKYNTGTHIYIPIVKRGVVDHAVSADWTPAAGDVKISKDGGAAANVTNLPVAIAMGNSTVWDFSMTATEMSAAKVSVTIADSATKAVEDNAFNIITYGNASAEIVQDISASVAQTGDNYPRLGAPAGASHAADIASVKTDTGTTIPGRLPAALAADGSIKASIQSILGTAFTEGAVGRIAAGFKALLNVASPVFDLTSVIQSGDSYSRLGAPAGASVSADVASIKTDTSGTATKLGGITLLKHWLGAIMGKQSADATALTEIRASGAGAGSFDPTTDSVEALRDRGDAAWITATGFSTLDATGIRTAVGLATANLDTQLAAIQLQIPADLGAAYQNLSNVQATKVLLAVLAGQTSGLAGATAHMKKLDGSADVVVASIDADGNRGVPTLTP